MESMSQSGVSVGMMSHKCGSVSQSGVGVRRKKRVCVNRNKKCDMNNLSLSEMKSKGRPFLQYQ